MNLVVADPARIELVLADARAQRRDDRANLFVPEHFVVARLFDIQDFSFERQDGLVAPVAPLFGRASGRFALNNEYLAAGGVALLAIGELAGQPARIHRGFSPRQLARLARRFTRARRLNALADNAPRHGRMLVKVFAQLLIHKLLDVALDVAVQFALGLPLELRLRQPHGNDGNQPFAHVIARDRHFVLLLAKHSRRRREVVDRARQRRAKPGQVRPAVHRVDRVGKGENVFAVRVVVLQRDFDLHVPALSFHEDGRIVQRRFAAVDVLNKFRDAAGEAELGVFLRAFVAECDL